MSDEEEVGPVGVLEIYQSPEDGRISFAYGAKSDVFPAPANGQFYTEEEVRAMPIPYGLTVVALHLVNEYVKQRAEADVLALFGKPEGGQVH